MRYTLHDHLWKIQKKCRSEIQSRRCHFFVRYQKTEYFQEKQPEAYTTKKPFGIGEDDERKRIFWEGVGVMHWLINDTHIFTLERWIEGSALRSRARFFVYGALFFSGTPNLGLIFWKNQHQTPPLILVSPWPTELWLWPLAVLSTLKLMSMLFAFFLFISILLFCFFFGFDFFWDRLKNL